MSEQAPNPQPEQPQEIHAIVDANGVQRFQDENAHFISKEKVAEVWQGQIDAAEQTRKDAESAEAAAKRNEFLGRVGKAVEDNPNRPDEAMKALGLSQKDIREMGYTRFGELAAEAAPVREAQRAEEARQAKLDREEARREQSRKDHEAAWAKNDAYAKEVARDEKLANMSREDMKSLTYSELAELAGISLSEAHKLGKDGVVNKAKGNVDERTKDNTQSAADALGVTRDEAAEQRTSELSELLKAAQGRQSKVTRRVEASGMWAAPNAEDAKLLDRDNPASPNYDPEPGAARVTERGLNRPASVLLNREAEPAPEAEAESEETAYNAPEAGPKSFTQRLRERWAGLTARIMSPEPAFGRRNRGEDSEREPMSRRKKLGIFAGAAAVIAAGTYLGHRAGLYELPFTNGGGSGARGGNGDGLGRAAELLGDSTPPTGTTVPNGETTTTLSDVAELLSNKPNTGAAEAAADTAGQAIDGATAGAVAEAAQQAPIAEAVDFSQFEYPSNWASMDELHRLSDLAAADGYQIEWHNLADGNGMNDWLEINGQSDTESVLKVLSKYA